MNVRHNQSDGSFDVVLEPHDPLPLEWARCACARIVRRVEGTRIVVVKPLGEVLEC